MVILETSLRVHNKKVGGECKTVNRYHTNTLHIVESSNHSYDWFQFTSCINDSVLIADEKVKESESYAGIKLSIINESIGCFLLW